MLKFTLAISATLCAAAIANNPRISSNDGSVAVNIAAGRSFSIACPDDSGQCAPACAGADVEVRNGECVPTVRFATATALSTLADQLRDLDVYARSTAAVMTVAAGERSTIQSQIVAANTAITCMPYVEYTNSAGDCVQLNRTCDQFDRYGAGEVYEARRPTRSSDRVCRRKTVCTQQQYATFGGNGHEDRVCAAVTNCSALNPVQYLSSAATPTSDAVCVDIRGLTQGDAAPSCQSIKAAASSAPTGLYWIVPGGMQPRRTTCDMTTDGGGWTLVANGYGGNNPSCWRGNADCRINYLANGDATHTAKMSNEWLNGLAYTRIRMKGSGSIPGAHFWKGKDAAGGCTYNHNSRSSGSCNCASPNVDLSSILCGNAYPTHRGVGDWGRGGSCLHSYHTGSYWYHRKVDGSRSCGSHGSHFCYGTDSRCNMGIWVR